MFSHISVKVYCHGSFKHVELAFPPYASQNSLHQVEILLVLPNILKPPFFFNNYRLVSVEPMFLLVHMSCAILAMPFYFAFLAV